MSRSDYWNPVVETASPSDAQEVQATKLRRQLRYVLDRSPFYRKKFDEAGFDAERVRNVADLSHAPFTLKDELRESQVDHPPLGGACGGGDGGRPENPLLQRDHGEAQLRRDHAS